MVAIILVNYNGWQDTVECVRSLQALRYNDAYQIIIVDNASTDASIDILKKHFGHISTIKLIASPQNGGFAAGNNLGIRQAILNGAEYIWMLNNDTIVHPDSLRDLVQAARQYHPALIGGKVYRYGTDKEIWFHGAVINWKKCEPRHIDEGETDNASWNQAKTTQWISGCSIFGRADIITLVPMDERYFLYLEDVDYSLRIAGKGVHLMTIPGGIVWHKSGASTNKLSCLKRYYYRRGQFIFMWDHAPWLWKIYFFSKQIPQIFWKLFIKTISRRIYKDEKKYVVARVDWIALQDVLRQRYGKKDKLDIS